MTQRHTLASAAALWLAASGIAFAADAPPSRPHPVRDACKADMQTFCKDAPRARGAMADCLAKNQDKLSQGCKDAITQRRAERGAQGGTMSAPPAPTVPPKS